MKKNIKTVMSNPFMQKSIMLTFATSVSLVMLLNLYYKQGHAAGMEAVLQNAERMTPGFIESFQKFMSAEHFGWKS